jgi:hypothetical protein
MTALPLHLSQPPTARFYWTAPTAMEKLVLALQKVTSGMLQTTNYLFLSHMAPN